MKWKWAKDNVGIGGNRRVICLLFFIALNVKDDSDSIFFSDSSGPYFPHCIWDQALQTTEDEYVAGIVFQRYFFHKLFPYYLWE